MTALRVAILLLIAFALRAGAGDESLSALDLAAMEIVQEQAGAAEAPLPYLLARLPGQRGWSVLCGTLAVGALLAFGRRAFHPTVGWIAAGLMAVSPYFIHDSARLLPHALSSLLAVLHLWAAWRFGRSGRLRDALLWGGAGALAILTQRFAACAVGAVFAYLLVRDRRWLAVALGALPVCAALLVPVGDPLAVNWSGPRLDRPDLFARLAIGTPLAIAVYAAAFAFGFVRQRSEQRPLRLAFGLSIGASLGAALIAWPVQQRAGLYAPIQMSGAATVALLPVAYAIGSGLTPLSRSAPGWALLLLILALQQIDGRHWLKSSSAAMPLARFVQTHEQEGDMLLATSPDAWRAFAHAYEGGARRPEGNAIDAARDQLRRGGRIWFIGPAAQRFDTPRAGLLRALRDEAELAYQWEGIAADYHQPLFVLLFQSREVRR